MSKWAGKFVIGLTGNIGTGKSVVRKMLEHLGAYGIDADSLAHRAIAKAAPGYRPVTEIFGEQIIAADGQIDRRRLGQIVFNDPDALVRLEAIIHPLVDEAIDLLVRRSRNDVVVIEAIKLIEAGIAESCDSIWVTYSTTEVQSGRLVKNRKMTEAEAKQRIDAQPAQERKLAVADVVINNMTTIEDVWKQVVDLWKRIAVNAATDDWGGREAHTAERKEAELKVVRGKPRHSEEIAALYCRTNHSSLLEADIVADYGDKAFLLLMADEKLVGVLGWRVENLISQAMDIAIDIEISTQTAFRTMINAVEQDANNLKCEASMLFVKQELVLPDDLISGLGYERQDIDEIDIQAWKEAAEEVMAPGLILYVKQLRKNRILRPI